MFKSLKLKNAELFKELMDTFENTIKRDSDLDKALKRIGKGYLGIEFSGNNGIFEILDGLLS